MTRILIISEVQLIRTFLLPAIKQLKKEADVIFDCLIITNIDSRTRQSLEEDFDHVYINDYPRGLVAKIPKVRFIQFIYGLRKISRSLPDYDIAHINYHHYYLAFCAAFIRKKSRKFYVSFYGSDFNQVECFRHLGNKYTVKRCDGFFATNGSLLRQIDNKYSLSYFHISRDILFPLMGSFVAFKVFLERYSRANAKESLGLNKPVIVCGYNAAPITRHREIIDALESINSIISDYKVVFPMTYGIRGNETRLEVKAKLLKTSLDYIILDKYLSLDNLQYLRLAADIFIHIQSRDQLSASMLEHLAAGSVVITGKWLPYDTLVEQGVYFIRIDSPQDLSDAIVEVVENLEEHQIRSAINREIVLKMTSWENIKPNWHKYYELESKQ